MDNNIFKEVIIIFADMKWFLFILILIIYSLKLLYFKFHLNYAIQELYFSWLENKEIWTSKRTMKVNKFLRIYIVRL
jgi:hypothetical protein